MLNKMEYYAHDYRYIISTMPYTSVGENNYAYDLMFRNIDIDLDFI